MTTVISLVTACDTGAVHGLSQQIIAVINQIVPGVLVDISDLNIDLKKAQINPYLQPQAKESLNLAIKERGQTLVVNSVYRTIAQQFLIRKQYEASLCGIAAAARPGTSNHESGLAVDVVDPDGWQPIFAKHAWHRLGAWDPPHFDCLRNDTRHDLGMLGIKSFQKLWNQNNPNDRIEEDGIFGQITAAKLANSPASGF